MSERKQEEEKEKKVKKKKRKLDEIALLSPALCCW